MSRQRRAKRGQALVEFALVVPLLLALVFGIVEFALITTALGYCRHAAYAAARSLALAGASQSGIDAQVVRQALGTAQGFFAVQVTEIDLYQVAANGGIGSENAYDGSGNLIGAAGWPVSARVGTVSAPLVVGVRITFIYHWLTSFVGATGTQLTLTASATAAAAPGG